MKTRVHKEFDELDPFELEILWREEAILQLKRIRRTNEADGYNQQEGEDEQR